jgi:hypothetical protein
MMIRVMIFLLVLWGKQKDLAGKLNTLPELLDTEWVIVRKDRVLQRVGWQPGDR